MSFDLKSCSVLIAIYNRIPLITMYRCISNVITKRFNCLVNRMVKHVEPIFTYVIFFFFLEVRYCLLDEHDIWLVDFFYNGKI